MPDDPCFPPVVASLGTGPTVFDVVCAVREHAADRPNQTAVKDGDTSLGYADLLGSANAWAAALVRRGVTPGDRVGVHLPDSADYIVVIIACLTIGAVFVPIPYGDPENRSRAIARDCDVTLTVVPAGHLLSEEGRAALVAVGVDELVAVGPDDALVAVGPDDALVPLRPHDELVALGVDELDAVPGAGSDAVPPSGAQDVVCLAYTSGATGKPKGAMIRREGLRNVVANTVDHFEFGPATRALCASPFHCDGALGSIFSVLAVGGTLVVAGAGRRPLPPGDFLRLLLAERITHTSFSPGLLRLLTASPDLPLLARSRLRTVGLGGKDCSAEQIMRLLDHRPELRVFHRYGPAETTAAVASHLVTRQWCESGRTIPLGLPDPGVGFHLVDDDDQPITAPRTPGELCVSGVQVMAGYWGAPEESRQVLGGDLVPAGTVHRTGDVVERTEDGLYVYLDRVENVVKRHGHRISMTELTAALLAVPGVADAVALVDHLRVAPPPLSGISGASGISGISGNEGGFLIRAFVVAPDLDAATVRGELLKRVPATMNPDTLHVITELPRLSGGRPDARRLRELV